MRKRKYPSYFCREAGGGLGGDLGVGHGWPAGGLKIACHERVNAR